MLTRDALADAARKLSVAAAAEADALNALDGALGDGDLGVTVSNGWAACARIADDLPDDLGQAFLALAKAHQHASSSSFGTLTATALMAAAKACKGRKAVDWSETAALLLAARDAMMARGKGELGQKSALDMMDALARATEGLSDPHALRDAAAQAGVETLDAFRDRMAGLGRARMFGAKTIGMDDPGMRAIAALLNGLKENAAC